MMMIVEYAEGQLSKYETVRHYSLKESRLDAGNVTLSDAQQHTRSESTQREILYILIR